MGPAMPAPVVEICNCTSIRKAARHVTQFYDRYLAPTELKTTQFSVLSRLERRGPTSINALARELAMDRTTLSRAVAPLERAGLLSISPDEQDGRARVVRLTEAGAARIAAAREHWHAAQAAFEEAYGVAEAEQLRATMAGLVATPLAGTP
jgi:DNA-binding MarR family transcriptional regulator